MISGQDIKGALNYNEQKVLQGKARCIQASLFLKELDDLGFYDKLDRFTALNGRNRRARTNTLHISLNFAPGEKLPPETLNIIASTYMEKIGFANQPYLVYEHTDAAHPHVHILTTLIQEDSKRIPIHYLGKNKSEAARKEIERDFGLVPAQGKAKRAEELIRPADLRKAVYGKSETRRGITDIVRTVTRSYKFTSIHELNAVLREYNVTADRGTELSRMFARKGLLYSLIDEQGKRIGIPVKASAIYGKPTLPFLEKQFKLNEALRQPFKDPVRRSIDKVLRAPGIRTTQQFSDALKSQGITVKFRTTAEGRTYGVTFVDHRVKVVFNGSDLGKSYSAKGLLDMLSAKGDTVQRARPELPSGIGQSIQGAADANAAGQDAKASGLVADLLAAENLDHSSPEVALKLRRRKKRKGRKR